MHGDAKKEGSQFPVEFTEKDFELIPEIISDPDILYNSDQQTTTGLDAIVYEKSFEDGNTYYIEEVRKGRKKLALKTMYKGKSEPSGGLMQHKATSTRTAEPLPDSSPFEINVQNIDDKAKPEIGTHSERTPRSSQPRQNDLNSKGRLLYKATRLDGVGKTSLEQPASTKPDNINIQYIGKTPNSGREGYYLFPYRAQEYCRRLQNTKPMKE